VHLSRCEHPTSVRLPEGYLIPIVVFNRTGDPITVDVALAE
jgi:hypothetical protein